MTEPHQPSRSGALVRPPRSALARPGEEIMRACASAVLGPLLPLDDAARAAALEASMAHLDDYLAHFSAPLQRQTRLLFAALDLLPVRLLLLGSGRHWSAVAPARVAAFLERARGSRFFLLRRTYVFLQSMAVVAWFDLPMAWNEIGYPGPTVERQTPVGASR